MTIGSIRHFGLPAAPYWRSRWDGRMTRVLLLTLLIAACSGDGSTGVAPPPPPPPPPIQFVLVVKGSQTGTPGPYCVVTLGSPASLSLRSRPGATDSAVATLGGSPGRLPLIWDTDLYDANGFWVNTVSSRPGDSTSVPGSAFFTC